MAGNSGKCPSFHHFGGRTHGMLVPPRIGDESPRSDPRALSRHFLCPTSHACGQHSPVERCTGIGSLGRWALRSPPPSFLLCVPSQQAWTPRSPARRIVTWWVASGNATPPIHAHVPSPLFPSALSSSTSTTKDHENLPNSSALTSKRLLDGFVLSIEPRFHVLARACSNASVLILIDLPSHSPAPELP
jgi:hypothetical protein